MFPLSHMLKSFVRIGTLKVIDADGQSHAFVGAPGPRLRCALRIVHSTTSSFSTRSCMQARPIWTVACGSRTPHSGTFSHCSRSIACRSALIPCRKCCEPYPAALRRFQQANPVGKAQKNVAHHYDLGNDFYKLFLDEGMNYSCAYFLNDDETLEQAQRNKLRLIAAKLHLKPGLRILDIGSGWGDLAFYLAALEDVDVTGRDVVQRTTCPLQ